MRRFWLSFTMLLLSASAGSAESARPASVAGIELFNRALIAATRDMDNAATLALWEDDGVSLLPSTPPIVGKAAISGFMDEVTASIPGGKMKLFDMTCFDVEVSGDTGSEWCQEHQIVQFADGKPPFEGWGKMLFVLHGDAAGRWRISREMWNQAAPPRS